MRRREEPHAKPQRKSVVGWVESSRPTLLRPSWWVSKTRPTLPQLSCLLCGFARGSSSITQHRPQRLGVARPRRLGKRLAPARRIQGGISRTGFRGGNVGSAVGANKIDGYAEHFRQFAPMFSLLRRSRPPRWNVPVASARARSTSASAAVFRSSGVRHSSSNSVISRPSRRARTCSSKKDGPAWRDGPKSRLTRATALFGCDNTACSAPTLVLA